MRIDSGLSNYFYRSRFPTDEPQPEEPAADAAAVSRSRGAGGNAVSSTLLSPSLASALWVMEGGRRSIGGVSTEDGRQSERMPNDPAQRVEAFYREYALPADDGLN